MKGNLSDDESRSSNSAAASCRNIQPDRLAVILRDVWGDEATAAVHQYTGAPDRTCRSWCESTDAPSSRLIQILRGKEGYRILRRIMQPDAPQWWIDVQLAIEIKKAIDGVGK